MLEHDEAVAAVRVLPVTPRTWYLAAANDGELELRATGEAEHQSFVAGEQASLLEGEDPQAVLIGDISGLDDRLLQPVLLVLAR